MKKIVQRAKYKSYLFSDKNLKITYRRSKVQFGQHICYYR